MHLRNRHGSSFIVDVHMGLKKMNMQNKWIATYVFSLLLLMAVTIACGSRTVHMTPASTQPAAEGTAKLDHDKNGNLTVDLKVKHLAKPQNLTPPKSTYLVWMQPSSGEARRLGELRVNDNLQGEFKSPVPVANFQLFVTAEDGPTVTQPSGTEVLRQTIGAAQP